MKNAETNNLDDYSFQLIKSGYKLQYGTAEQRREAFLLFKSAYCLGDKDAAIFLAKFYIDRKHGQYDVEIYKRLTLEAVSQAANTNEADQILSLSALDAIDLNILPEMKRQYIESCRRCASTLNPIGFLALARMHEEGIFLNRSSKSCWVNYAMYFYLSDKKSVDQSREIESYNRVCEMINFYRRKTIFENLLKNYARSFGVKSIRLEDVF